MLETIGAQGRAGRVGAVEPLHPLRHLGEQLGIARHRHHGVHARDRLEAHHALADTAVAALEDALELADHRLRGGRLERIDPDRLVAQPFHVESGNQVERRLALRGGALDQDQVA